MKYFKPELLARYRSHNNDVSDQAAKEWEQAAAAYRKRLRAIRQQLPAGARRIVSHVALHDAKVLAISIRNRQPLFTIFVQLEGTPSQPGKELTLRYRVVEQPHAGLVVKKRKKGAPGLGLILYDEFNLDKKQGFFTHSLLLTNGDELQIRFRDLHVVAPKDLIVSSLELPEGERTWISPSPKP